MQILPTALLPGPFAPAPHREPPASGSAAGPLPISEKPPMFLPHRYDRLPPHGSAPGAGSGFRPRLRSHSSSNELQFCRDVQRGSRDAARASQRADLDLLGGAIGEPAPPALPAYRTLRSPARGVASRTFRSPPGAAGGEPDASPLSPYRPAGSAFGSRSRVSSVGSSVTLSPPALSSPTLSPSTFSPGSSLHGRHSSAGSLTAPSYTMLQPAAHGRLFFSTQDETLALFDEEMADCGNGWHLAGDDEPIGWEDSKTPRAPSPEPGYLDRLLLVPLTMKISLASPSQLSDPKRSEIAAWRGDIDGQRGSEERT